jgi:3D (Asp-Asp-Asp) domain-containing protein
MIRNSYWFWCLLGCLGSLLQTKSLALDRPLTLASSKQGSKIIPSSRPLASAHQAKETKPQEVVLTSDLSRAAAAALAAKQESPAFYVGPKNSPLLVIAPNGFLSRTAPPPVISESAELSVAGGRLARVTAYWAGEGDYYTRHCISATGVRLHEGHCAVDPTIIPYGSVVEIAGLGKFLAVDTGSAVVSRTAAREGGHTSAERNAIVVDLFFESPDQGERFAAAEAKFTSISWWTPTATNTEAREARRLFAEEDWSKIENKQL